MQLDVYIKDLLYRYECIIIPGFGAFLTHHQPARIDTETHSFFAPCKRISFNKQLQTNDGLLANYIAGVEKISYEAALADLRRKVSVWKQQLSNGESLTMLQVGTFSQSSQGTLSFEPDAQINYLTSSFGLSSFTSQAIEREVSTPADIISMRPKKSATAPLWRYAAVGLIAIGLASFSGMYFYASGVEEHNLVEKQKADALLENKIQEATFVFSNPLPELKIPVKKIYGKYHVVAGAFRMEENAFSKIEELKAKGFDARMIGINRYGLHQVVYDSYTERAEALRQLSLLKKSENPDAWLLVQELND
jgi:hypothetical protein